MRIGIGADHAGCVLKDFLAACIRELGHEVQDFGTNDPGVSVDYPAYASAVARDVVAGKLDIGVLVCGTGIGMSISANKIHGIRAALAHDVTTARLAREHNNANVLAIGGRLVAFDLAADIVETFLDSTFSIRHQRRLDMISDLENGG